MAFPSSRPSRETSGKLEKLPEGAPAPPKKAKDLPQTAPAPAPPSAGPHPAPGSYCPHTGRGSGNPRREAGRCDLQDLHSARVSLDSADPAETPDLRGPGDGERAGAGGVRTAELEGTLSSGVRLPGEEHPPHKPAHPDRTPFQQPFPLQGLCPEAIHSPVSERTLNQVPRHAPSSVRVPLLCLRGGGQKWRGSIFLHPQLTLNTLEELDLSDCPEGKRDPTGPIPDPNSGKSC